MPIPESIYSSWEWRKAQWALAFALCPHRCEISNKMIWFEDAYRATSVLTGPGDPIIEHIWLSKNQYLLEVLKGTIT
jgi:hypothetical protein